MVFLLSLAGLRILSSVKPIVVTVGVTTRVSVIGLLFLPFVETVIDQDRRLHIVVEVL